MERQHRRIISNLILIGAAATAGLFCLPPNIYLAQNLHLASKIAVDDDRRHVIPPIIARSVSDTPELESDTEFVSRSSVSDTSSQAASLRLPYQYRRPFGPAREIQVQFSDSDFNKKQSKWSLGSLAQGVRVEIWLQRLTGNSGNWEWLPEAGPHIVLRANGPDFDVELDKELGPRGGHNNPNRQVKRKYRGNPNVAYRFGRIKIYKGTSNTVFKQFESDPADHNDNGDSYSIAFFPQLARR